MSDSGVCAVVVTFNRKNLLLECLESLRKQSISLDSIYVIDNASSDGTGELLLEMGILENYHRWITLEHGVNVTVFTTSLMVKILTYTMLGWLRIQVVPVVFMRVLKGPMKMDMTGCGS